MRQIRIPGNKVEQYITEYLKNIGYDVVEIFTHTKGITVGVSNEEEGHEEFERTLVEEVSYD